MLHIIHAALRQIPIFEHLDLEKHAKIIQRVTLMYYPAGYTIFRAGDTADKMYIVKSGEVEIFSEKDGLKKALAIISQNGFFGEMALIEGKTRNASAETLAETEVFILDHDTLRDLLADVPEADVTLAEEYIRRRDANG